MENLVTVAICAFFLLVGATVGSFLNVLIWRLPRKMNFVTGRSICPICGTQIKDYDLIPILSYLLLRAKCRQCRAPISPRYPLVELLTGGLFVLCFLRFGLGGELIVALCAASILVAVAFIDHDTMEIPNGLVIALGVPAVASLFLTPEVGLLSRLLGFFAISLPLFLLAFFIQGAFGGGDIKLMAVAGALLGLPGVLCAFFLALVTGGLWGAWLLGTKRAKKGAHIPFGPHLCFGIFVSLLYGGDIVSAYLRILLP